MQRRIRRAALAFPLVLALSLAGAADDPRHVRHELMESVGDAAKTIGRMIKGEAPFDADSLNSSLQLFLDASGELGSLFPPGTETGEDTRAAPDIWHDRDGFELALGDFRAAVEAAIEESPDSLEEARPAVGPVFNACKNCHDRYRLEKD